MSESGIKIYEKAAKRLSHGKALDPIGEKQRILSNRNLHPFIADHPGLPWPASLAGNRSLFQGWRECGLINIQPGGGKTSGFVIPQAAAAPGACVITTNKWDGVKESLAARAHLGGEGILFDAMGILGVEQEYYFDPIPYVHTDKDAAELANIIADADQANNSRTAGQQADDQTWGPVGRKVLTAAILCAVHTKKPLSMVQAWISSRGRKPGSPETTPDSEGNELIPILRQAGYNERADALEAQRGISERTRTSIWFTVDRMVQDLSFKHIINWSTPAKHLKPINLAALLTSRDTLILASTKKTGGAGLLVMAIIHFLKKEAEKLAATAGGRLPIPLVLLLDEVCNIVAWPTLPDDLSYFGSLGVIVNLFFQGFDQGERVFTKPGMDQIIKMANMRWIGGGEAPEVARAYSSILGDYYRTQRSYQGRGFLDLSTGRTKQLTPILTPAQIAQMHKGLGILYAQELQQPCIGAIVGWHETHHDSEMQLEQPSERPESIWTR